MSSAVTLALVNANVLTMEHTQPRAQAVALAGERIAAVGSNSDMQYLASGQAEVIDCRGLTLLPGFNDAHCHLPGLARRLQDLDCSPERAPSIPALQELVHKWAKSRPAGSWVRGFGYDDRQLAEGRHPTRHDLDIAAPECPVWLEHRSGHAVALNGRALDLAGIRLDTPDTPGGLIERDPYTGEPTGILFEMRSFLRGRLGNIRRPKEFEDGMRAAGQLLAGYGITSAQDAGADNGIGQWQTFQRLLSDGVLRCRITMFAGFGRLGELSSAGLPYSSGNQRLRLGHAKIILTLTSGVLHPSPAELEEMIAEAHGRGFPVAIHCIEEEAIAAAAEVLTNLRPLCDEAHPHPNPPPEGEGIMVADRIEHCAEGTPELIEAVRRSSAMVVTQPGFVYHNGPTYRRSVEEPLLPHLYPAGALHRAGVPVAFGSDAPVIDPNPWPAIYSATTRRASDRLTLSGDAPNENSVSMTDALRMYTIAAAGVEGTAEDKGSITPGKLADFGSGGHRSAHRVNADDLPGIRAVLTIVNGSVVWGNI